MPRVECEYSMTSGLFPFHFYNLWPYFLSTSLFSCYGIKSSGPCSGSSLAEALFPARQRALFPSWFKQLNNETEAEMHTAQVLLFSG